MGEWYDGFVTQARISGLEFASEILVLRDAAWIFGVFLDRPKAGVDILWWASGPYRLFS